MFSITKKYLRDLSHIRIFVILVIFSSISLSSFLVFGISRGTMVESLVAGFLLPGILLSVWGIYLFRTGELFSLSPATFIWIWYILFVGIGFWVNLSDYALYDLHELFSASFVLFLGILALIIGYYGKPLEYVGNIRSNTWLSSDQHLKNNRLILLLVVVMGLPGVVASIFTIAQIGGIEAYWNLSYGSSETNWANITLVRKAVQFAQFAFLMPAATLSIVLLIKGNFRSLAINLFLVLMIVGLLLPSLLSKSRGRILEVIVVYLTLRFAIPKFRFQIYELPKLGLLLAVLVVVLIGMEQLRTVSGMERNFSAIFSAQRLEDFASGSLDHYYWLVDVLKDVPQSRSFLWGWSLISPFLTWIPRNLWIDKPYGFGKLVYVWQGYPFDIPSSTGTLVVTEYYANFGIMGVIILSFLQGVACRKLYRFFLKYRLDPIVMALYTILLPWFTVVRGDFHSATVARLYPAITLLIVYWFFVRFTPSLTGRKLYHAKG